MEKGQWLYLVDVSVGVVTKNLILEIHKAGIGYGIYYNMINISGIKNFFREGQIAPKLNPTVNNYAESQVSANNCVKPYLIFTEEKSARQALIDYVLVKILNANQQKGDKLIKEYNNLIKTVEQTEAKIKQQKIKLAKL